MVEKFKYQPINTPEDLERLELDKVGCLVFVVDKLGRILTVEEKTKTGVESGSRGILCETRRGKRNNGEGHAEFIGDNVVAAVLEEMGVSKEQANHLYWKPGVSYVGRTWFPEDGKKIAADVVVLFFDGVLNLEEQRSRNEVGNFNWMTMDELKSVDNLRKSIIPACDLVTESNTISRVINENKGRRLVLSKVNQDFDRWVLERIDDRQDLKVIREAA